MNHGFPVYFKLATILLKFTWISKGRGIRLHPQKWELSIFIAVHHLS